MRAFTLIELLVVVTVVAVLLALLAPALDTAMDAAERTVCASRLHQWGNAVGSYWLENRRKLMGTVRFFRSDYPYPNVVWVGSPGKGGEFAVDPIRPYIQGVTEVGIDSGLPILRLGGAWYCPGATLTPTRDAFNTKRRDKSQEDANNPADAALIELQGPLYETNRVVPPFFVPDYSYYGQVGLWAKMATRPGELTDRSLEPGRLLMSDSLYRWNANGAWSYNHSPEGFSIFSPNLGGPNRTGVPPFSGVNQLMGDGSVWWKAREHFEPVAMEAGDDDVGAVGTTDRNFH